MITVLILGAAILGYHHVVYPAILRRAAIRRRRHDAAPVGPDQDPPSIALIVPARDEAAVIAAKIADVARLDYPADRLTLVLALDGCRDATEAVARRTLAELDPPFAWEIVSTPHNCGKVAVLNREIGRAGADLVALSDASALVDGHALRGAAAHFTRGEVGVVCGAYRLSTSGGVGEVAYWRRQTALKADEAAFAAPMGAHGAFYVFRRRLWTPLPIDVVNDDFILPMRIVEAGHEAVYDATIVATELEASAPAQDFRRRVRLGAGNLQQAVMLLRLADPRRPRLAFVFLSGKGLRAATPLVLLAMASAALVLSARTFGLGAAAAEAGAAIVVARIPGAVAARMPAIVQIVAYAIRSYAATALGALLWATGLTGFAWRLSSTAGRGAARIGAVVARPPSVR